ncbi:hypothetical protein AX16_006066 [Volvariella volvacea WC 439]|nr:hypothetical protein AX16_006066 [Volvariella volvacea WC 439]
MKWIIFCIILASLRIVFALPNELSEYSLAKRAVYNDSANIGYATLNGGTTGGSGGPTVTVSTLSDLTSAVSGTAKKIVLISGLITGSTVVRVGSNTSVIGLRGSSLVGIGLRIYRESNVIIRNIRISSVVADAGDAISIQEANHVWIDHVSLSSDLDHDKDYYGVLLSITHGAIEITVSWSTFYNSWKGARVGHSDSNGAEDIKITVTFAYNYWRNINSCTPCVRFGHAHIYNNVYDSIGSGICAQIGAQLLVENNVFSNTVQPLYSVNYGLAVARGNDFGGGANQAPTGTFTSSPYVYGMIATSSVRSQVASQAGAILSI